MIIDDIIATFEGKVKRVWVDDEKFFLNAISDPSFENAVVGSFSLYNIRTQTCYILPYKGQYRIPISPTSLSRRILELMLKDNGTKWYPKKCRELGTICKNAPLYAIQWEGDAFMFDLKSAFLQIYSKMPVFLCRQGDDHLISPPWMFPHLPSDLPQHKLLRNALVGCWRSHHTTRIKNGMYERRDTSLPTTNFHHWNFVQDVLHHFASVALECGATYIHTDGYIIPEHREWKDFKDYVESWGFCLEERARGFTQVYGIGRYHCGDKCTKLTNTLSPIDKVDNPSNIVVALTQLRKYNPHFKESHAFIFQR